MSEFLKILENEVQIFCLIFLAVAYIFRIKWLLRFKSQKERTFPAGDAKLGVIHSMMNISMPWAMESARKKPVFYIQFVIFHIGIAVSIGATFIIPYWPHFFHIRIVVLLFQILAGAAFLVGIIRLYRRLANPAVKLISTADDYFSLVLMILYLGLAVLAIPNTYEKEEWPLLLFFSLTAFILVYVPFSKIGHYLYYPFTRFFIGRTMGHRGVGGRKSHRNSDKGMAL